MARPVTGTTLTAEAHTETNQAAIFVLNRAAQVLETNGFYQDYLWDTVQAATNLPPEDCRVDVAGALAIALHGSPRYAGAPRVRAVEQLLLDRVDAPGLAAWYIRPGVDQRRVVALLRDTAAELRAVLPELAQEAA